MATKFLSNVLNGKTNIQLDGYQDSWEVKQSGTTYGWNGYVDVWGGNATLFDVTTKIVGTRWKIGFIKFEGKNDNKTTLYDDTRGADRQIGTVWLGKNSDVDLKTTKIKNFFGKAGGGRYTT